MLAQPTKGIGEVLDRLGDHEFTCEYKYDGERAQIHYLNANDIRIYSRNAEDHTSKYPDIIKWLPETLTEVCLLFFVVMTSVSRLCYYSTENCMYHQGTSSFILDSEVVAWDRASGKILPFQILSTRKRKDVEEEDVTVQVS